MKTTNKNINLDDRPIYRINNPVYLNYLIKLYYNNIYSYVYFNIQNKEQAEDLTQEVWLKICANIKTYELDRPFENWIITIARNHLVDYKRQQKREEKHLNEFELEINKNYSDHSEQFELTFKNIYSKYRILYILRYQCGLKYKEISEITLLSMGTISDIFNKFEIQYEKN